MQRDEALYIVKIQKTMAQNQLNFISYDVWEKQSVFKLPPHITSLNADAFKPIVISFGPYHYKEQHLMPMEAHKMRSFNRFLYITGGTVQGLIGSFKPMEQELMDHYNQLGDEWRDGDHFLELMIKDGCFMLDILLSTTGYSGEYDAKDPVFGQGVHSNVMRKNIKRDMLLVENQLPLLVLKTLIAGHRNVFPKLMGVSINDWISVQLQQITKEEFLYRQENLKAGDVEDLKTLMENQITIEEVIHKKVE